MAITNVARTSSSLTNNTKINIGETWNTDLNTWNAESRTWNAMASIIGNATRLTSAITNYIRAT